MDALFVLALPFFVAPALYWLALILGEALIDWVGEIFGGR